MIWGLLALPERACNSTMIWNFLFLLINLYYARKEYIKKSIVRRQQIIKAEYVEKLKSTE